MQKEQVASLRRAIHTVGDACYEQALAETGGGWFDGACWHFASALHHVLRLTGVDAELAHVSRIRDGYDQVPDHGIVVTRSADHRATAVYWDADGPQPGSALIKKMRIEGGHPGRWGVFDATGGFPDAPLDSPLVSALTKGLYTALTPTYYHVTPERNLVSILKHGLMPQVGPRSREQGESGPALYAFPTYQHCEDAMMGWLGDALGDDRVVILAIQPTCMPEPSSAGFEVLFTEPVPASAITGITTETGETLDLDGFRHMMPSAPSVMSLDSAARPAGLAFR
jgi:hypothetical protein